MTTARSPEQHTTVYCPMFQNDVIIETCEGDKIRSEKPCRYFQGYGLWYVHGYHGRDVKYGVGCNFTHEDWEEPTRFPMTPDVQRQPHPQELTPFGFPTDRKQNWNNPNKYACESCDVPPEDCPIGHIARDHKNPCCIVTFNVGCLFRKEYEASHSSTPAPPRDLTFAEISEEICNMFDNGNYSGVTVKQMIDGKCKEFAFQFRPHTPATEQKLGEWKLPFACCMGCVNHGGETCIQNHTERDAAIRKSERERVLDQLDAIAKKGMKEKEDSLGKKYCKEHPKQVDSCWHGLHRIVESLRAQPE